MWYFGLNRKIKKAIARTRKEFEGCQPPVYDDWHYGMVALDPKSLVIWYIFQTDGELEQARACGLCGRIAEATAAHLEKLRYPANVRGRVSFASQETIDNTPGGPRCFFQ